MKAVRAVAAGGPGVLETADVAVPEPGPRDVQIAVRLAGVNFADVNARRGTYRAPGGPAPRGLGLDLYGEVRAVGAAVTRLRTGQRVAGFAATPAYAEVAVAHADLVWPVPDEVSDEAAASYPVVGQTAYHLLKTAARLRDGESVLVTAAAGGVGATAIQVARLLGAGTIVGAAGSPERAAEAVARGADAGVDYSASGVAEGMAAAAAAHAVDVALDGVGGAVRRGAFHCLNPFGRLVHFGNASGEPEELPTARTLRERGITVVGFHLQTLRERRRGLLADGARHLLAWLADGRLTIPVADVLPLNRAADAHRLLESRRVSGKLLLSIGPSR
ncbi:MAG TPA: zinc-binding dehydrogenase [Streptosporangiaceae bacterium]|jgi:NADPH2:quinone reductase